MVGVEVDDCPNSREQRPELLIGLPEPGCLGSRCSLDGAVFADQHRLAGRQAPVVEGREDLRERSPGRGRELRGPVVTVRTRPVYVGVAWIVPLRNSCRERCPARAPDPADVGGPDAREEVMHMAPGGYEAGRRYG